jgi:hypothetical protein
MRFALIFILLKFDLSKILEFLLEYFFSTFHEKILIEKLFLIKFIFRIFFN